MLIFVLTSSPVGLVVTGTAIGEGWRLERTDPAPMLGNLPNCCHLMIKWIATFIWYSSSEEYERWAQPPAASPSNVWSRTVPESTVQLLSYFN